MKTKYFNSILEKRSIILLIAIISLICCNWTTTKAQDDFCDFDDYTAYYINENTGFIELMEIHETELQDMIDNNPQAIMNNEVYTIPVVFHVVHLGETEGIGSNISDARIYQALQDLNDDFRDVLDTAYDVKLEFCLAVRDPSGNLTDGINRVDGSTVTDYSTLGLAQGHNELDVKTLSVWPNDEYINIWVVHDIPGNPTSQILGIGTFPGTFAGVDGIVLLDDATGTSTYSGAIAHEMGHFLNLYHTFHGGDETTCPPSGDCTKYGDRICDTDPHKKPSGGCPTGSNPCAMDPIDELSRNHMNYTDNSCRNAFTGDQAMRMRGTLMSSRASLMNSLACDSPCTTVEADFLVSGTEFDVGSQVTFTNTSVNGTIFSWVVNDSEVSTNTDLTYTFNYGGAYEVCLFAADTTGCINKKCTTITILPVCVPPQDTCEEVPNWKFEQISDGIPYDYMNVCGWKSVQGTPFFCNTGANKSLGFYLTNSPYIERATTEEPLGIEEGSDCFISFDYWVTGGTPSAIQIALVPDNDKVFGNDYQLPPSAIILAEINDPPVDEPLIENHTCHNSSAQFNTYYGMIEDFPSGYYLTVTGVYPTGVQGKTIFFIDNISINCCGSTGCEPEPDFTYDINGCSVTFNGTNTGDPGMYYWDFGDGTHATGQDVSHEYLVDGTYEVCLIIQCDAETISEPICTTIVISSNCDNCDDGDISIQASQCEESGGSINTYMANFSVDIPKGYSPCIEDFKYIYANPDEVSISVENFNIDDSDPNTDVLNVGILINVDATYNLDLNGAKGHLMICGPNGEQLCYNLLISGSTCDVCEELDPVTLECDDITDGEYYYEGSVTIDLPFGPSPIDCGSNSSHSGFSEINRINNGNGTMTINFSLNANQSGSFSTNAMFCIDVGDTKYCYTVTIEIDPPCPDLPTDCVRAWGPKSMSCSDQEGGYDVFNFAMNVSTSGYQICSSGLFGTIDGGGEVVVNSATSGLGSISFDVDILMPTGFDQSQTYELRLYLCDEEGNIVCFLFPFNFSCGEEAGGNESVEKRSFSGKSTDNSFSIFPNPTSDRIFIESYSKSSNDDFSEVVLIDNLGRVIHTVEYIGNKTTIDVSSLNTGIYYITISKNDARVHTERIVIIR